MTGFAVNELDVAARIVPGLVVVSTLKHECNLRTVVAVFRHAPSSVKPNEFCVAVPIVKPLQPIFMHTGQTHPPPDPFQWMAEEILKHVRVCSVLDLVCWLPHTRRLQARHRPRNGGLAKRRDGFGLQCCPANAFPSLRQVSRFTIQAQMRARQSAKTAGQTA